jgi:hypothetical protein
MEVRPWIKNVNIAAHRVSRSVDQGILLKRLLIVNVIWISSWKKSTIHLPNHKKITVGIVNQRSTVDCARNILCKVMDLFVKKMEPHSDTPNIPCLCDVSKSSDKFQNRRRGLRYPHN